MAQFVWIPKQSQLHFGSRNQNKGCLRLDVQGGFITKRHKRNFEGDERVLYLNCSDGYMVLYNVKIHPTEHLRSMPSNL